MPVSIGCDIGGTSIQATVLRGNRPCHSAEIATPTARREVIAELSALITRIGRETKGHGHAPPVAAGVGFCGLLDARRRGIVRSTHLPHLDGCRLAASLERRIRLPVLLDADTNCGAVGEATLGAGRGFSRVLYVTLGTGLGAALVVDREPVRASHHTVGQISELRLRDAGPREREARAEDLLSGRGILTRARREGIRGLTSTLDLFERARQGNAPARRVWRQVGEVLGRLLHTLVSLWSPDVVVIAGGTAGAAALFLPAAERGLSRSMKGAVPVPSLRTSARGRFTGAIGAALLARRAAASGGA